MKSGNGQDIKGQQDVRLGFYARKVVDVCDWAADHAGDNKLPVLVDIDWLCIMCGLDRWKTIKGLQEAIRKGHLTLDVNDMARIVVL
jgi:hypothetical protein